MGRRSIPLIVALAIVSLVIGALSLPCPAPTLEIELDPPSPLSVRRGESFSLEISVRNDPGLRARAEHVRGELVLPEGFIEESLQTWTRQLIFGDISPGDASHYGLTITALDTVEEGEYHASLTVRGSNIPAEDVDLEITVLPS